MMVRRYLLIRLVSGRTVSGDQFFSALMDSVRRLFGEFGLAKVEPRLIRFDTAKSEAIVACKKEGVEDLNAAIALISINPSITSITLRVSGTIKGLSRR